MRIFLTGATGYLGSAILDGLLKAGHEVTALVRDPEQETRLEQRGVTPVRGELSGAGRFATRAAQCDVVIHAALADGARRTALDHAFLDAVLPALAGAGAPRAFIYTSGIWVLGATTSPADETAGTTHPAAYSAWRVAHERDVLAATTAQLRTIVVRPGIVYGGARGIVADMVKDAGNGLVRVVGDGANHWPCIYDRDLAELYTRLVAAPEATGIYHAVDEQDERVEDVARALAEHASPVADIRHMPLEEALEKLGPYADALALDQVVRCPRAHALGWAPTLHGIAANAPRLFEEHRRASPRE